MHVEQSTSVYMIIDRSMATLIVSECFQCTGHRTKPVAHASISSGQSCMNPVQGHGIHIAAKKGRINALFYAQSMVPNQTVSINTLCMAVSACDVSNVPHVMSTCMYENLCLQALLDSLSTCMLRTEACTIIFQLINSRGAPGVMLVITDVALTAKDKTSMPFSTLSATMSSTNATLPVGNCFDNNNNTRCVRCQWWTATKQAVSI